MKPSKIHLSRHYGDTLRAPKAPKVAPSQAGARNSATRKDNFEFGFAPFMIAVLFVGVLFALVFFTAQSALAYTPIKLFEQAQAQGIASAGDDIDQDVDIVPFTFNAAIIDGGQRAEVQTDALTVGELLTQHQVVLSEGDIVFPELYTAVEEGITVEIFRAFPVYVNVGEERRQITIAQGTVKDALEKAQVVYDEDDEVTPAIYFPLTPEMEIIFEEVIKTSKSETTMIQFKTLYTEDDTLEEGKTKLVSPGVMGEFVQNYDVLSKGDNEIARVLKDEKLITSSVDEVVAKGTKPAPKTISVPKERSLKNDPRPDSDPPKQSQIRKTIVMEATAYTHTGNKTATGTKPKVGTVAVNIKQIPYGTKLYIEGYGYAVAEDTGGFRHNGRKRIDLFMDTKSECMSWGRRDVKVYVLK